MIVNCKSGPISKSCENALEKFGMLYLITLEIPPFPLMLSNVILKRFYSLSINATL